MIYIIVALTPVSLMLKDEKEASFKKQNIIGIGFPLALFYCFYFFFPKPIYGSDLFSLRIKAESWVTVICMYVV
jgi:hypothetical protein